MKGLLGPYLGFFRASAGISLSQRSLSYTTLPIGHGKWGHTWYPPQLLRLATLSPRAIYLLELRQVQGHKSTYQAWIEVYQGVAHSTMTSLPQLTTLLTLVAVMRPDGKSPFIQVGCLAVGAEEGFQLQASFQLQLGCRYCRTKVLP